MTDRRTSPARCVPAQRTEFFTTDPDEARAFIDRMYTAHARRDGPVDRSSPVRLSQVRAGEISSVDFTTTPDLTLHLDGTDDLSVTTLLSGSAETERGDEVRRFEAGDVFLGAFPGGDYAVHCHRLRVGILTVSAAALARVTAALPERTPERPRFVSMTPVSPAAGEQWRRAAEFTRQVVDDDHTAASPLVLGDVARLLAATALAVFPNNLLPEHGLTGPVRDRGATPDTLRRAEEFLRSHAHLDIDLAALAAACDVTARALQYAFARHHDMSPMQYLRRVRLTRAHQDLLAADPADGATVTDIATRWGFPHPGRFAAAYRRTYGVPPRATLYS